MKTLLLGTFAMFVIFSQVACSDDSGATAAYAAANNCTIGADGQQVTGGAAAAQAQVPCSLQNASKIASSANLSSVAAAQVSPGAAATSTASMDSAVKAQAAKVQTQLAALDADKPALTVKTESIDTSRAPASIEAPVAAPPALEGGGDIIR